MICSLDPQSLLRFVPRFEKRRAQPFNLKAAIIEPVGAPYPMKAPTKVFEHILTQAVPFPGPQGAVIGRAITLHAQHVTALSIGMDHPKYNGWVPTSLA